MAKRHYALQDNLWERIKDVLHGREGHVGGTGKDNRLFERVYPGIAWRDLPERFGDFRVIHTHWSTSGVWQRMFEHLAEDADTEYAMIDSTIVRAHQHSAGATGGTGRRNASGAQTADGPRTSMHVAMRRAIPRASI